MKFPAIITKPISTAIVLLASLFGMVVGKDAGKDAGKAGVEWLFLAAPLETRTANMIHDCGASVPLLTETNITNLRCVFEFGWRDKELNAVKDGIMTSISRIISNSRAQFLMRLVRGPTPASRRATI